MVGVWIAWAQTQPPPAALTTSKITNNLYMIRDGGAGNVGVLVTDAGVILVDDMFGRDGPGIAAEVKKVTDKSIKYIISTHHHADHTGSNDMFRTQGIQIVMHRNARANLVNLKQPGLSHIAFGDESDIYLGGTSVQVIYAGPGHTNGDAVVYFPSERTLHAGDLFVSDGEIYIDMKNGGTIRTWDETVRKILQYDFDVVIPGHGPIATRADLVRWVGTLQELRKRIGLACEGGAEDSGTRLDLSGLGLKPIYLKNSIPMACDDLRK
jgi:glyoxylase-like metal-dependent hydrolase (beta-lactamase superfamily II)